MKVAIISAKVGEIPSFQDKVNEFLKRNEDNVIDIKYSVASIFPHWDEQWHFAMVILKK